MGLDDNETVDLTFSAQIGGVSTTTDGLFWTGAGTYVDPEPYLGIVYTDQPI